MQSTLDLFDLSGKVAVVTGAGGYLGLQHADVLAEAGADVVVADLSLQAAQEAAQEIANRKATKALPVEVDVSNRHSVDQMMQDVLNAFGQVDILINNAALTVRGGSTQKSDYFAPFEVYDQDLWQKALDVNLTGTYLCSQAVGKQMVEQERGVIVNICSIYGVVGPDQRIYADSQSPHDPAATFNTPASYSATKGGILALTRYLATYWAEKNIRVNALTPGGIFEAHDEAFTRAYAYRTPMGRMGNKDELRGAILYLASDASSYMTGSNLVVDGGWTAW